MYFLQEKYSYFKSRASQNYIRWNDICPDYPIGQGKNCPKISILRGLCDICFTDIEL